MVGKKPLKMRITIEKRTAVFGNSRRRDGGFAETVLGRPQKIVCGFAKNQLALVATKIEATWSLGDSCA
jgi:hypothetical protein